MSTFASISAPGRAGRPLSILPNITAGAVCAIVTVAYAGSFANLIFGGALSPYVAHGMLAALVASVAIMLVLSWQSSFAFSLGGPDSNPSAILAFSLAGISQSLVAEAGPNAAGLLPTALAFLFCATAGCGVILFALGRLRWGRYVRYIPHAVISGFLGGTGYLLVAGAYKMLTGASPDLAIVSRLAHVHPVAGGVALAVAATLVIGSRFTRHFLLIPIVLLVAVTGFYVALHLAAIDIAQAHTLDLLLPPIELSDWHSVARFPYADVRWDLVLAHWKDVVALTMVVAITILLNATSIDLATGKDADYDRELKALGAGNLVAGLAGGLAGTNSFNRSMLNLRAGANSPQAARISALIILAVTVFAPGAVGWLPRPVLTGLILYLGVSLLITWTWETRRTLTRVDHLTVLVIVAMIAAFGVAPGVLAGVVIACVSFVFSFSRTSIVKYAFTGASRRSNVERTREQLLQLRDHGRWLHGFVLQGFLFFGTASRVLDEVRAVIGRARYLVIDFALITSLDASSTMVLRKIRALCRERSAHLVLTGLSPQVARTLRLGGLELDDTALRNFPDLDHGLEWCEEAILAESMEIVELSTTLAGAFSPEEIARLREHFERVELKARATLVRDGEASDAMFLVEHGRLSVNLRLKTNADGTISTRRLRSYGVGTIVGEMGFFTGAPRSADVVADLDTRLLRLTHERVAALEREHAELALRLHRLVVAILAERLRSANEEIRLLV